MEVSLRPKSWLFHAVVLGAVLGLGSLGVIWFHATAPNGALFEGRYPLFAYLWIGVAVPYALVSTGGFHYVRQGKLSAPLVYLLSAPLAVLLLVLAFLTYAALE